MTKLGEHNKITNIESEQVQIPNDKPNGEW